MKYVFAYISNCSRLTELHFFSVKDKASENKNTLKEKLNTLKQGNGSNPNLATGLIVLEASRAEQERIGRSARLHWGYVMGD